MPRCQTRSLIFCFNPRTREGCDAYLVCVLATEPGFNPRTREGCDKTSNAEYKAIGSFQSTHPRGVRLTPIDPVCTVPDVSIHAPARGATAEITESSGKSRFQSTHPRGVRLIRLTPRSASACVSIHAPARGATTLCKTLADVFLCFNPRTREGCDIIRAGRDF